MEQKVTLLRRINLMTWGTQGQSHKPMKLEESNKQKA
jgi:hypothetical protein